MSNPDPHPAPDTRADVRPRARRRYPRRLRATLERLSTAREHASHASPSRLERVRLWQEGRLPDAALSAEEVERLLSETAHRHWLPAGPGKVELLRLGLDPGRERVLGVHTLHRPEAHMLPTRGVPAPWLTPDEVELLRATGAAPR